MRDTAVAKASQYAANGVHERVSCRRIKHRIHNFIRIARPMLRANVCVHVCTYVYGSYVYTGPLRATCVAVRTRVWVHACMLTA